MSGNQLTQSQLREFEQRTRQMENKIAALQRQIGSLQSNPKRSYANGPAPAASEEKSSLDEPQVGWSEFAKSIGFGKNEYGEFEQPDPVFPPWYTPYNFLQRQNASETLQVVNSYLPMTKVPFKPKQGRLVKWYSCGPTVYAPSHLGHARTYITFDIIRNILEEYFGYTVQLVMNITDVDDKIILRARQNYLRDEYLKEFDVKDGFATKVLADLKVALQIGLEKRQKKFKKAEEDLKTAAKRDVADFTETLKQEKVKLGNVENDTKTFAALEEDYRASTDAEVKARLKSKILEVGQSYLAEKLDGEKGHTVTDKDIYDRHSRHFEMEYFEDMRALNIRDPSIITRVTEYVPEIIKFVERIVSNGYGYESNGSVYFDVARYRETHEYPKLDPKKMDSKTLLQEGEGALSQDTTQERKSSRDFALWKKSKAGEPFWESPWGKGRPGWHIECSVMATAILGDYMDIHTGGKDLKFPHHDNEMAQTCAYLSDPKNNLYPQQWVNYWFHTGHLDIRGQKMSKSLKNFKTIRQGLEMFSMRQIRLMFVGQSWNKTMDFSESAFEETRAQEHRLSEFFHKVNALQRIYNSEYEISQTNWTRQDLDVKLFESISNREVNVDKALRDNFDYPTALRELFLLMGDVNKYIDDCNNDKNGAGIKIQLINQAAKFVNDMLKIFGCIARDSISFLGNDQIPNETYLRPVLDVITALREDLVISFRNKADSGVYQEIVAKYQSQVEKLNEEAKTAEDDKQLPVELIERRRGLLNALNAFYKEVSGVSDGKLIVTKTDELRDNILPQFGIKIEDQQIGNQMSFWKMHSVEELKEEAEMMAKAAQQKQLEAVEKKIRSLQNEINDWEKKKMTPLEYLQTLKTDDKKIMYTKFNEKGEATHDADGSEITNKKALKRAKKFFDSQAKQNQKYEKQLAKNSNFLDELKQQLTEKEAELSQLRSTA